MNQVIPFNFESHAVRTVVIDEAPWWVGRDVCDALGYQNSRQAMNDHCKGVSKRYPLETEGGTQEVRIISEPDVFRLIVSSHRPQAQRFEKWLFEEALPQIRKTGGYVPEGMAVVRKDILDRMCDRLAETIQEICRLNRVVAASGQPRADLEQVKQDVAEIKEDRRLIHYLIDKNEKLQRRGTRLSEDERRDIWFKHRSGMAVARIEQETGRDASSIRRIIKRGYRR